MKRKDLLRKLKAAGLLFKEGGEHTRVQGRYHDNDGA